MEDFDMVSKDLSGCEKLIMKIVWDASEDISTQEIIETLARRYGKEYARTTVVTFLQRLTEKGFVETYRVGRVSYVRAIKDEERYKKSFLRGIRDFWFQGDLSNLFVALCENEKISKKEIEKIRKVIDELDD